MSGLDGKVIVVTGGASGIGEATCLRLAERGARLIVSDIDTSKGEALAARLGDGGHAARFFRHDVSSEESWLALLADIAAHENMLHGLVNNAGIVRFGSIQDTDDADWCALKGIMLHGPFLGIRLCAPLIERSGGGAIVNILSRHALWSAPNEAAYAAIKASAGMLARCAAREWAGRGVRINSVLPGPAATSILDNMPGDKRAAIGSAEALIAEVAGKVPLGRIAAPDEIVNGIEFLLSDAASFMIGAELVIDGGISA